MDYLKVVKQPEPVQPENNVDQAPKPPKPKPNKPDDYIVRPISGYNPHRTMLFGPFVGPGEEKNYIKQIEKMVEENMFEFIMKIARIYTLNIITRN